MTDTVADMIIKSRMSTWHARKVRLPAPSCVNIGHLLVEELLE